MDLHLEEGRKLGMLLSGVVEEDEHGCKPTRARIRENGNWKKKYDKWKIVESVDLKFPPQEDSAIAGLSSFL